MKIGVVTLFPELVCSLEAAGVVGRALKEKKASLQCWNPRDFSEDRHQTVDDRPYGGGPGMVMMAEPLDKAVLAAKAALPDARVAYLSPQGKRIVQQDVAELASRSSLILIAGRYEGIDERFITQTVDEEWSLGDFVLSGGELAAMAIIDAMVRLLPGVLGHEQSAAQDSFSEGLLDCPHYTRPECYNGELVPPVLLSGNHRLIERWRLKQSVGRTWLRRPDLLEAGELAGNRQLAGTGVFPAQYKETGGRVLNDLEHELLQEFLDELKS
ncbi:MAG: tRNA (guanosine(37)-N1)-methyltransferase TrmD [Pseudomonadales bacterium]|nr:tRNA (guanosine(37)-N1)-methyltransferase TrmD [Pseudomonadales bacterium]